MCDVKDECGRCAVLAQQRDEARAETASILQHGLVVADAYERYLRRAQALLQSVQRWRQRARHAQANAAYLGQLACGESWCVSVLRRELPNVKNYDEARRALEAYDRARGAR